MTAFTGKVWDAAAWADGTWKAHTWVPTYTPSTGGHGDNVVRIPRRSKIVSIPRRSKIVKIDRRK